MCIDMVEKLETLWRLGNDEERQAMARSLFTEIVFDLDTRRIVDFKLKPWADRFLTIRVALYEHENDNIDGDSGDNPANSGENEGNMHEDDLMNDENDQAATVKGLFTDTERTPVWGISVHSLDDAAQSILTLLYADCPRPLK